MYVLHLLDSFRRHTDCDAEPTTTSTGGFLLMDSLMYQQQFIPMLYERSQLQFNIVRRAIYTYGQLDTYLSRPKHIGCLGKIWVVRPSDNTSN